MSPRWLCQHLLDGHDGLVLSALGALVQHGAEAQPVGGHLEVLPVKALAVQQRSLPQVLHGWLQPVLVLLDECHLHVHLAAEQDHEAGGDGRASRGRASRLPWKPPRGPAAARAQLATAAGPWALGQTGPQQHKLPREGRVVLSRPSILGLSRCQRLTALPWMTPAVAALWPRGRRHTRPLLTVADPAGPPSSLPWESELATASSAGPGPSREHAVRSTQPNQCDPR